MIEQKQNQQVRPSHICLDKCQKNTVLCKYELHIKKQVITYHYEAIVLLWLLCNIDWHICQYKPENDYKLVYGTNFYHSLSTYKVVQSLLHLATCTM